MSIKEVERLSIMRQSDKKIVTIKLASIELGISLRQTKRVRKPSLNLSDSKHALLIAIGLRALLA